MVSNFKMFGDDIYYAAEKNILSHLYWRYNNWSTRLIIDALIVLLAKYGNKIFVIMEIMIVGTMPFIIYSIFKRILAKEFLWAVIAITFLYNIKEMLNAGYIASSLNYIWPLFFLLAAIALCLDFYTHSAASKLEAGLLCLCVLFATNQEQMLVVFLCFIGILNLLYYRRYGRINAYLLTAVLISLASLAFTILAPANHSRYYAETLSYYPEFFELSFLYKLYLGFIVSWCRYFMGVNLPYIVLSLFLFLAAYGKSGRQLSKNVILYLSLPVVTPFFLMIANSYLGIGGDYIINAGNLDSLILYLLLVIFVFTFFALLWLIYAAFADTGYMWHMFFIFFMGLGSRMMMGFSPTIHASSFRTFILMDFSFVLIAVGAVALISPILKKNMSYVLVPCCCLQAINYLFKTPY